MNRARCFKCHTNLATGQENVLPPGIAHEVLIAEPLSPQDIPTDPHSEPTVNPVQSSNVFDDEVADIEQVHCDSELFEFEFSTSSPSVNVRGNLSRNFEFWKRIGTPSFILNVIEKGIFVTVRQFSGNQRVSKTTDRLSHMPSLLKRLFQTQLSRVVFCKLRYRPGSLTPCLCLCKLMGGGFRTNEDKSVWIHCQRLDWLGITWDSFRGTIEIVNRRVFKISIPLTVLLPLILFFLPEDWPLLQGR